MKLRIFSIKQSEETKKVKKAMRTASTSIHCPSRQNTLVRSTSLQDQISLEELLDLSLDELSDLTLEVQNKLYSVRVSKNEKSMMLEMRDVTEKQTNELFIKQLSLKVSTALVNHSDSMLAQYTEQEQYIEKLFAINQQMIVCPKQDMFKNYLKEHDMYLQKLSKMKDNIFVDLKTLSLQASDLCNILSPMNHYNLEKLDVNQLVYEVMKTQSEPAELKMVKINFVPLPHLEKYVKMDGKKFQQLCFILLRNAIKYSTAGGSVNIHGKIVRKTKDGVLGKYFELSIKDEG